MSVQVKLSEIVEAYEVASPESSVFVNRKTGEIVEILNEFLNKAENEKVYDGMIGWQQEMMKLAYYIIENEELFIKIPTFEVSEYDMMERLCFTLTDPAQEDALYNAIKGKGAFSRFKQKIYELGVADDWYDYRDAAYEQHAKDFCTRNDLKYVGD